MTLQELKYRIYTIGHETHFFDADTLKFFGERYSDMRVLSGIHEIDDYLGNRHKCYVISAIRRKNFAGRCKPYTVHHYFDTTTYHHIDTI